MVDPPEPSPGVPEASPPDGEQEPSPGAEPADGASWTLWLAWSTVLLLFALWGTTVAGRTLRSPPAALAIAVTLLPWLYGGAGALVFALWCVLPDRRVLPAVLVAIVLSAGLLYGPSWPARQEIAAGEPVRVMTWNVQRLWGGSEDAGDPTACVVETVRAEDPDLLALLEVSAEDVEALAGPLGLECVHTDYLATGRPRAGGLAACARGDDWTLVGGEAQRYVDPDDWHYVFSEMAHDGRVLNLLAVHLNPYYPLSEGDVRAGVAGLAQGQTAPLREVGRTGELVIRSQGAQSVHLLGRVARFQDPSLLVGDFNSTRDAALHTSLRRVLVDAWERGGRGFGGTVRLGGWIPLRIDYVYATDAFAVRGARVPARDCSDHRPVVTDLVLRDEP